jgi:DNA-binding NtrC family response regulator
VIDLTMPRLTGEELARRALEADPNLRVLLSSGYATDLRALETDFPGRVGFLHKPFSADMLAETVRRLLPVC